MTARVIVYTGKGGVGKTSVAAASALLCADQGHRTLVVSTDIAHSLGDAFGESVGPDPTALGTNLWAQETDVYHSIRMYWGEIQKYFAQVFQWRGLDAIVAEEMSVLPGLDELACLLRIIEHFDSGRFDVIVVDAAPTGETVRLLSLPEAARWWLDRIMPIQKRAVQLAGPMLRRLTGMPMPGDAVFRAGEDLFRKVDRMHELLSDPDFASIRIVLNLERMVIAEARRSFTYFHLFGYPTDLVVCNRVLPVDSGAYFAPMREAQQRHYATIEEAFAPVPIRMAPYFGSEVVGQAALRALGTALFDADDPATVFHRGRPYRVDRQNGHYTLTIDLPFATEADVDLTQADDELVVQVGPWRRNLLLPRMLADMAAERAEVGGGILRVHFAAASSAE